MREGHAREPAEPVVGRPALPRQIPSAGAAVQLTGLRRRLRMCSRRHVQPGGGQVRGLVILLSVVGVAINIDMLLLETLDDPEHEWGNSYLGLEQ